VTGSAGWLASPAHARWLEAEGDRLLEFGRSAAHPDGGFAWLSDDGSPQLDRPVELWITCRMTHVYSLGHLLGRPGSATLADHGVAALQGRFRDAAHGGWYAQVAADGPTVTGKTAYEHAFVVLAAASAAAAGRPGGRALLDDALEVLLDPFWDDQHGMVVEEWDEGFTRLDGYRGVNANMHSVEALLSAADVLDDASLRARAERIVTRVVHDLARRNSWRIPEHFDADWTPRPEYNVDEPAHPFRPYGATIGHWLEWARLALHLRAGLGASAPGWLLEDARELFDAATREGWAVDGADGFVYTVDWSGQPGTHALGRRGGHRNRRGSLRRDGGTVVRRVVRDLVELRRRPPPRPRARLLATRADADEPAEQHHVGRQAGHLPRIPGHAPTAPTAGADAGQRSRAGPVALTGRRPRASGCPWSSGPDGWCRGAERLLVPTARLGTYGSALPPGDSAT
jgi:sulfoquinovose isomerase